MNGLEIDYILDQANSSGSPGVSPVRCYVPHGGLGLGQWWDEIIPELLREVGKDGEDSRSVHRRMIKLVIEMVMYSWVTKLWITASMC